MSSHTPGPWERNGNAVHKRLSKHYAECVAIVGGDNKEGDANLIAAAPDLLEACKLLMEHIKEGLVSVYEEKADNGQPVVSACELIESAIAKATGDS
jgi:hypothetical protein